MKTGRGRIFIFAYDFPPRVRSGSYRPMRFAKALSGEGREVIVCTASELDDPREVDRSLLGEWTGRVRVVQTFSPSSLLDLIQDACSRLGMGGLIYRMRKTLLFPDEKILWSLAVLFSLFRMRPVSGDIVITTSPPWSVHLIGLLLRRTCDVRWIADHRDPWTQNPHFRGKGNLTKKLHHKLETLVHTCADAIITASHKQKHNLQREFDIDERKVLALYSGYEEEDDFSPGSPTGGGNTHKHFVFLYAGACYQDYVPDAFLEGLAMAFQRGAGTLLRERVRVVFLLSAGMDEVFRTIERLGLSDVAVVRPAVAHSDLGRYLRAADCLLLTVPDTDGAEAWVPGKTFEYLSSGKPVLAIVPPDGEVASLVTAHGRGTVVPPSDPESIRDAIEELVHGGSGAEGGSARVLSWEVLSVKLTRLVDILSPRVSMRNGLGRTPSIAIAASGLGIVDRGVERFTADLGRTLGSEFPVTVYGGGKNGGDHRHIACTRARDSRIFRWYDALPPGLARLIRRLHLDPPELEKLTFSLGLLRIISGCEHDIIIQSGGFWGSLTANLAEKLFGVKVISVGHGGLGGALEELTFETDHYVTVNPAILDELKIRFPRRDLSFIPTTVETSNFKPGLSDLQLDVERPVFLTVGALDQEKRIDLAIGAVARLGRGSLLVIGSGPLEQKLRALGDGELGRNRFRILSVPKERMVHYYNFADVFTMPSVREAFPLAMLEAMSCDLPVVTVREGSRALFGNGTVTYCDPVDAGSYAAALLEALSGINPGKARRQVLEYDCEKIGRVWADLIREVSVT